MKHDCRLDAAHRTARGSSSGMRPPDLSDIAGMADAASAGGADFARFTTEGVEATQAIQNMNHDVPLVAGKTTIVRVYLGLEGIFSSADCRGVLLVQSQGSPHIFELVPSMGNVVVQSSQNGNLQQKREDEALSLNFELPERVTSAGSWQARLILVRAQLNFFGLSFTLNFPAPADAERVLQFVDSPPLRVRVLGIRYTDGTNTHTPSALDYSRIRSWLSRAFPVAEVQWSQVTVDGPSPWPFTASTINAFIRGIRTLDVASGTDHRTHYYGLVDDGGGFMRGRASGIPGTADPSTVASGPTGTNTWGWDNDGSYGDWYTAHELGHTYGRFHAMFCGAGGGAAYPYANGQLSDAGGEFVGFDVGDSAQSLPRRALPGTEWHDVMTYCTNQWLSDFTYNGIRDRLVAEDALAAPGAPAPPTASGGAGTAVSGSGSIHVVATINLSQGRATIDYVTAHEGIEPGGYGGAGADGPSFTVRLIDAADQVVGEYAAPYHADACSDEGDEETGIVDVAVPASSEAQRLELLHDGEVVATYEPGARATEVTNIHREIPAPTDAAFATTAAAADAGTGGLSSKIVWDDAAAPGPDAAAATAATGGGAPRRYAVEVSTDDGTTWTTIGFGLTSPEVSLDHALLQGAQSLLIRVTSTDGFRSVSSTQTIDV